jgi:hypothetical protein
MKLSLMIVLVSVVGATSARAASTDATPPAAVDAIPDKVAPGPAPGADSKKPSLSKKLDLSNGVIHPDPGIDPSMQKPAPKAGSMPVIPPAAVSPNAQPK